VISDIIVEPVIKIMTEAGVTGDNEKFPDGSSVGETRDVLFCLECGATLKPDAASCPECGKDTLILPPRWTPAEPGRTGSFWIGKETRLLVGLSLALFCALWMLGAARARNQARIDNLGADEPRIVVAGVPTRDAQTVPEPLEIEVPPDPVIRSINELRLAAIQAENHGAWYDLVDALTDVTNHPDADFDDFMALADAYDSIDDQQAAKTALNRVCVRFPDRPEGYTRLGELHEQQDNLNAARFQYEVGLTYCPGNRNLMTSLARIDGILNPDDAAPLVTEPETAVIEEWLQPEIGPSDIEPGEVDNEVFIEPEPDSTNGVNDEPVPVNVAETVSTGQTDQVTDESAPVTLFDVVDSVDQVDDSETGSVDETNSADTYSPVQVSDLKVSATDSHVIIEIVTSRAAALSTSLGSDPVRLFVRIPDAQVALGSQIPGSLALNVPLVERINVIDGSDTNVYISLVIYLGDGARYSVSSQSSSVIINIESASE